MNLRRLRSNSPARLCTTSPLPISRKTRKASATVQSYLDVQGGRAIVHVETEDAKAIFRYTSDWPEVKFELFPVVPSETGWETYSASKVEPVAQA